MRRVAIVLALLPLLVGVASCTKAGSSGALPAEIISVRVGIPPGPLVGDEEAGRRESMFKAAHWTPVLVTIAGKDKLEGAELVVQTADADDLVTEYAVRLPVLDFTAEQPKYEVVTYARPGKIDSPINVSLRAKGQTVAFPEKSAYGLEPTNFLYATLGARLPGLRLPGLDDKHFRRSEIGAIDQAGELPTRWQGYHTIDLAVLTTSNDDFMRDLLNHTERRQALVEWVRRGGKLVLTVSKNQALLQNREDLKEFLPVDFAGTLAPESVQINWGNANDVLSDSTGKTPLTIAKMTAKPDRNVRTIVKDRTNGHPLVMEANYGLGRITVVALDPDQPPFNRWKAQGAFWEQLLVEAGPRYAAAKNDPSLGLSGESTDDMATRIIGALDKPDGVPVISFGWVALFILLYILVVGPLDYLFLKKVVKRMELTWVTFPIVVLIVSAAAYFTAYAIKGKDQKINKLDLIDVDLHTKTVQGQTWFSIFSPRVQNYTIGVEPAEGWGVQRETDSTPLVSWMSRANNRRQSLFRRSYDYDTSVGGLHRVPIQVWSTKGFHASWHHRLDPAAPPLTVNLKAVGNDVTGSIVSHLPVPLEQVALFYRGKVYALDVLYPGAANAKSVTKAAERPFLDWSRENPAMAPPVVVAPTRTPFAPPPSTAPVFEPSANIMRTIMFHEAFEAGGNQHRTARNAGFRELDQSWRIHGDDAGAGAVLYGTLPMESGEFRDVIKRPSMVTQLWLGVLPGGNPKDRNVDGSLRQETHLRFFVPVKKSAP